jgi:hypothetical protein
MKVTITLIVLLFCTQLILPKNVLSQDNEEFRRVSLSLQGGITLGYENQTNRIFGSNYNVFTQQTYNFGGGLQYAISPFWSTELGYRYNTIKGIKDDGFETTIHSAVFKNILNFNRLYRQSSVSEWLNPYLILGLEHDFYNYELGAEENSGNETAILGGFGLAFSVSRTFDVFTQYEIKLASNQLDNVNTGFPYDQVGIPSAGIRINFGSSGAKPLNQSPAVKVLTEREYANIVAGGNQAELASEKASLQSEKINELEGQLSNLNSVYENHINRFERYTELLNDRIDSLEYRLNSLEMKISNLENDLVQNLRSTVPAGHYVQVFAATDYNSANNVKETFNELLEGEFDNPDEMVFVIKRGQFYEVLIGTFSRITEAQDVLNIATNRLSDSFILTFARPLHLEEQYRGLEIIQN